MYLFTSSGKKCVFLEMTSGDRKTLYFDGEREWSSSSMLVIIGDEFIIYELGKERKCKKRRNG